MKQFIILLTSIQLSALSLHGDITFTGTNDLQGGAIPTIIGDNAAGTISIDDSPGPNGRSDGSVFIGKDPAGDGTGTVGGANAFWNISDFLILGDTGGVGELNVNAGGTVSMAGFTFNEGNNDDFRVLNGSSVNVTGQNALLQLGTETSAIDQFQLDNGTLSIGPGGSVKAFIGGGAGWQNGSAITVSGEDASFELRAPSPASFNIKGGSTTIEGGATAALEVVTGQVALTEGHTVTIRDPNSLLSVEAPSFRVGNDASQGSVLVENGGRMEVETLVIGRGDGGQGSLSIDGDNSVVDVSLSLIIGQGPAFGIIDISRGGQLNVSNPNILNMSSIDGLLHLGLDSGSATDPVPWLFGANTARLDLIQNGLELEVELLDGFLPGAGEAFTIIEAGSIVGTFEGLADGDTFTSVDDSTLFRINYLADRVVLTVVPEPSTYLLMASLLVLPTMKKKRIRA